MDVRGDSDRESPGAVGEMALEPGIAPCWETMVNSMLREDWQDGATRPYTKM